MLIKLYLFLILQLLFSSFSIEIKTKLTFDEFFNYTTFSLLKFSPNGQYLLIQTKYSSWNTSSYENTLWLYNIQNYTKKFITKNIHQSIKPQWSPSGNLIALLPKNHSINDSQNQQQQQYIYLYSLLSNKLFSIEIGKNIPLAFTWSNNDSSLYLACINSLLINEENNNNNTYKNEWKDVIQYRENIMNKNNSIIYHIYFNLNNYSLPIEKKFIRNISSFIGELLYIPLQEKLIYLSVSTIFENINDFELYSIDLKNTSILLKLTNNEIIEIDLQLTIDNKYILFRTLSFSSNNGKFNHTQYHLYSLNLINGEILRLGENFHGNIYGYTIKDNTSIYILGQLGTEVHIYIENFLTNNLIYYNGWNGTYEMIVSSFNNKLIAFVYSSFEKPMEVYFSNNINQLKLAKIITNENNLFTQRNLPQIKVYKWKNKDDHRVIEGILHYPPEKFQSKNLPLLILIHGGPYWASLNKLELTWYQWTTLAAIEGWLVLEPNYRGSTGYGDQFLNEIRYKPISRPGKDILYGIDQLIKDGIIDPYRIAIGGYSYGGFLTNWLITQTKRFNAALSGAGATDYTSTWATTDMPIPMNYLFGGFPWEVPHIYQNESPIYQLDRVRTPTHIITGENDIRVPTSQSYILERGLHYLGIPVKLIIFPKEGHSINNNPWYGKIKVREELKWLQKYGNQSLNSNKESNNSKKHIVTYVLQLYLFFFLFVTIKNI